MSCVRRNVLLYRWTRQHLHVSITINQGRQTSTKLIPSRIYIFLGPPNGFFSNALLQNMWRAFKALQMNFRLSYEYFICSVILAEIESSRIYWGVFVHFKSFQTQFCLIHRSSSSSSSYKLAFYYICLPPLHVNVFTYKLQFLVLLLKFSCYVQPSKCFIIFIVSQLAVVQLA